MTHGNFNCKINCLNDGLVVLGLATSHHENKTDAGTPDWPSLVSPSMVSVFVGRRLTMTLLPPANKSTFNKKFYICSDATHTHIYIYNILYYTPLYTTIYHCINIPLYTIAIIYHYIPLYTYHYIPLYTITHLPLYTIIEGSLEVKLPTIWTDEKQSREEAERRERL